MTGVEKVRELAESAQVYCGYMRGAKVMRQRRLYHIAVRGECLAYGSYLRGLIELDKEWYYHRNADPYWEPGQVILDAIAAWKEVVND